MDLDDTPPCYIIVHTTKAMCFVYRWRCMAKIKGQENCKIGTAQRPYEVSCPPAILTCPCQSAASSRPTTRPGSLSPFTPHKLKLVSSRPSYHSLLSLCLLGGLVPLQLHLDRRPCSGSSPLTLLLHVASQYQPARLRNRAHPASLRSPSRDTAAPRHPGPRERA